MAMGPSYEFQVRITNVVDGDTVDGFFDFGFKFNFDVRF